MGRSTGAGGLAIWTHYLKGVEVKDWSDAEYTGKAIKIAAGTESRELLQGAAAAGLVAVTGECPTVGVAGGYIQNGGHSPLATAFGLAADQTLEFEVVTADGQLVTANPFSHADLFWALSGAGAGNYGVVVSVTLKAHPDAITSGAAFNIDQPGLDYPAILNAWHAALPAILDAGTMATYSATNTSITLYALTGYTLTKTDLAAALSPFITSLSTLPTPLLLQPNYTQFTSYHDHYSYYFGPLPAGRFGSAGTTLIGGRFLPRATLALPHLSSALNTTLQIFGVTLIGQAMNVSRFASPARAVLPQWRDAAVMSAYALPYAFGVPFARMRAMQDQITHEVMPGVEAATPGAGAYINEGDFQQRDWQRVFFGGNYERLRVVKRRYDPKGLFWNSIAVGSEGWEVREYGRLCEV
jgi:FAD/FMN-containing dehydrogenase